MSDLRPFGDWYLELARVTLFPFEEGTTLPLLDWWNNIVGEEPDEVMDRPKERVARVAGQFGGGVLSLERQPLRLDFKLTARTDEWVESVGYPNLGPVEDVFDKFKGIATGLISHEGFPQLNRIAYGCVLLLPGDDRSQTYQQLALYLPSVKLDVENSRDFLYRINRRCESRTGLSDLFVNRLSTWSVAAFVPVVGVPQKMTAIEPRYACRLELDVNTCQEFNGVLPNEKIPAILNELADMGTEIATAGDVS